MEDCDYLARVIFDRLEGRAKSDGRNLFGYAIVDREKHEQNNEIIIGATTDASVLERYLISVKHSNLSLLIKAVESEASRYGCLNQPDKFV